MQKSKWLMIALVCFAFNANAQELNCQVNVLSPNVQGTSNTVFDAMRTQVRDLMNNTRWTADKYQNEERIECQITITITERISTTDFKGKIEVKSSRPIYKSTYNSPMLAISDQQFVIKFDEFQILEYNETNVNPNFVSILAYYAYIIIGFDYDSYSLLGGDLYFTKAQAIVNQMTQAPQPGWKPFDSDRNRYWLTENLVAPVYRPIRNLTYNMHLKAMDNMTKDLDNGVRTIADGLDLIIPVHKDKPNAYLLSVFFDAKCDEFVNIFKSGPNDVKARVKQTLDLINPGHASKYAKILEN
jgi:hypothetical protein